MYQFDEKGNDVIHYAFSEARDFGHRFVGTEHLMLGLSQVKGTRVSDIFEQYHIGPEDIRLEIIKTIGRAPLYHHIEDYTRRAKECLERSDAYAQATNNGDIMAEHLFISLLHDKDSTGYKLLSRFNLDIHGIVAGIISQPPSKLDQTPKIIKGNKTHAHSIKTAQLFEPLEEEKSSVITQIGTELNEMNSNEPLIGRETEIDRIVQVLSRKTKNNALLIGEPGVGKTAIVRGLANRLAENQVPDILKNKRVIELNISALVSGTMYRGQFEERMNEWIQAVRSDKNVIVFIDEFHNLMGVGATGEKSLDAIGVLKPYLTRGELQIIAATTYQEFFKYVEPDGALTRRMTLIHVSEPSFEETHKILKQLKNQYEIHHDVIITDEAVKHAIALSSRYLPQRKWPDKAIDIIDEASSRKRYENLKTIEIVEELRYRLNQLRLDKEQAILDMNFPLASRIQEEEKRLLMHVEKNQSARTLFARTKLTVTENDIERVVSDWTQIPVTSLSTHEKERLIQLDALLMKNVFGQTVAVETVARALKRARMGIKSKVKPIGVYLFVGPTGVGKTELAKTIASVFFGSEKNIIKIDMSEYMERHSVSKLIGSPPGYEGNKEGGQLTNAIEKMPYSVVLFDEIEKAHDDIMHVLLQLMDEGVLKDGRGKQVHFKDALIVMTSNLGIGPKEHKTMGFGGIGKAADDAERIRTACKQFFKSEFINRLDEIIVFESLSPVAAQEIVTHQVQVFQREIEEKDIYLQVEPEVVLKIASDYFSETFGARPLLRGVDTLLKDLVVNEMLLASERPLYLKASVFLDNKVITIEKVEEEHVESEK